MKMALNDIKLSKKRSKNDNYPKHTHIHAEREGKRAHIKSTPMQREREIEFMLKLRKVSAFIIPFL